MIKYCYKRKDKEKYCLRRWTVQGTLDDISRPTHHEIKNELLRLLRRSKTSWAWPDSGIMKDEAYETMNAYQG